MTNLNECEKICIAALALKEGYESQVPSAEIDMHLKGCARCREEVAQLEALSNLLTRQRRIQQNANIWPEIQGRLAKAPRWTEAHFATNPLVLLTLLLMGYKLIELIPDRDFGFAFELIPLLLIAAGCVYLKQNPFRINVDLTFEGE